jgi:hypothetical protein
MNTITKKHFCVLILYKKTNLDVVYKHYYYYNFRVFRVFSG